jgi:hypothetical protein
MTTFRQGRFTPADLRTIFVAGGTAERLAGWPSYPSRGSGVAAAAPDFAFGARLKVTLT